MAGGQLVSLVGGRVQNNSTEFADTADEVTSTGALGVFANGSFHLYMYYRLIDLCPSLFFLPKATYKFFSSPKKSMHMIPVHGASLDVTPFIVAVATMLSLLTATVLVVKGPSVEPFEFRVAHAAS